MSCDPWSLPADSAPKLSLVKTRGEGRSEGLEGRLEGSRGNTCDNPGGDKKQSHKFNELLSPLRVKIKSGDAWVMV